MAKVRVNISIEEHVLKDLDWYAEKKGISRSKAIADLVAIEASMKNEDVLASVWDFICDLNHEIDHTEGYDTRTTAKCDAFYQVMGYVKAMMHK